MGKLIMRPALISNHPFCVRRRDVVRERNATEQGSDTYHPPPPTFSMIGQFPDSDPLWEKGATDLMKVWVSFGLLLE